MAPEFMCCREFGVKPGDGDFHEEVRRFGTRLRLRQTYAERGIDAECVFRPVDGTSVELKFTVNNLSPAPMTDMVADFCFGCGGGLSTSAATIENRGSINTAFSGPLKERNTDWTRRTLVPTMSGLSVVGDINRYFPVAIHRRMHGGENMVDIPIILCQSADYRETYAAGWECVHALYCAIGYCIHTIVSMGSIPSHGSATRIGRFYYMKDDPYVVLARFQRDFPKCFPRL
jgi:hypothetical protein